MELAKSDGEDDEKSGDSPDEPKKKKKFLGAFRSKKSDKGGAKTPSTKQVPPDGKSPAEDNSKLTIDPDAVIADSDSSPKPGWQKLFDMSHKYTNDGEGFGKWNVMVWEHFKKRVVKKDGKVVLRMKVSNEERFFET